MPDCDGAGTAERRYPTTEVRGSNQKYQSVMAQERLGGATPTPKQEARGGGREELPHTPTSKARGGGRED